MKITKIEDLSSTAVCIEPEGTHRGPLYDVGGVMTVCDHHLFWLGRDIADLLAKAHGLPTFVERKEAEPKPEIKPEPDLKPFTWG